MVGELVRTWPAGEPGDKGTADGPDTWVRTDDGETVRLATGDTDGVAVGSRVEAALGAPVTGAADGLEPARAADVTVLDAAAPTAAAGTPATDDVTVVAVATEGEHPSYVDLSARDAVVTAVNGTVHDFWAGQSDQAIQLTATAWPTLVVANSSCDDPYALWDEVADAVGFVPGPRKYLLLHITMSGPGNLSPCDYALAEEGVDPGSGGNLWFQGTAPELIAHQFGHVFGLDDAGVASCANNPWNFCPFSLTGDGYDVMGSDTGPLGSVDVAQAARVGLLPDSAVQTAMGYGATGQTYTLRPLGGRTGVRALKITDNGTTYWLEYRAAVGQDAWLTSAGLPVGVQVRFTWGDSSVLANTKPDAGGAPSVVLQVGQPVGIGWNQVTVDSISGSGATVRVKNTMFPSSPIPGAVDVSGPVLGDGWCARRPSTSMTGVALLDTPQRTGVFVNGLDHGLWFRPLDGSPWQSLGGGLQYGPAAVAAGSTSYVFVVGVTGELWYRSDAGSGWSGWTSLGGYLTSSPAAASLGDGHVRVFGRGAAGELWSRELRGGQWSDWIGHGGVLTAPPTATAIPDENRVEVWVRGTDTHVYYQSLTRGSGAAPYQHHGVVACSAIALPPERAATDPAFGTFVDNSGTPRMLESSWNRSLSGAFTSTPAVLFAGEDVLVAGRGTDNALWVWEGGPGYGSWRSLGGYLL